MKTITVEDKTWEILTKVKYDYKFKNLDEIIQHLLEIFTVDKLKMGENNESTDKIQQPSCKVNSQ